MKNKILWIGLLISLLQASANAKLVRPPSPDTPVPPFVTQTPPPPPPANSTEIPPPPTGVPTPTGLGAPRTVPEECSNEGFVFQNGQLILSSQNSRVTSQLYMFHNNSDYEQISFSHPSNNAMSGAGQSQSRLDQGQWSAITVNQPNFVINCFGRKPGVAAYVDCKSVLQVCSFPKAPMGAGGNYWNAENKSLLDTISSLNTKDVTMPK